MDFHDAPDGKFYWCNSCIDEYKTVLNKPQNQKVDGMKICSVCNKNLPISNYYQNRSSSDGLKSVCKSCGNKTVRIFNDNMKRLVEKYYSQMIMPGYRQCFVCKEIKELNQFGVYSKSLDGINTRCKCCVREDKRLKRNNLSTRRVSKTVAYCPDCKNYVDKSDMTHTIYGNVCVDCHKTRKNFIQMINRYESYDIVVEEYLLDDSNKFSVNFEEIESVIKLEKYIKSKICIMNRHTLPKKCVEFQVCNKCGINKPTKEYRPTKNSNTGFDKICRGCIKSQPKKKRDRTKEYKADSERMKTDSEYRIKKLLKHAIRTSFKQIGKKKEFSTAAYGIDFNLIYEHIGDRPSKDHQLDHIIPTVIFDFNNNEHIKLAHLPENLRWIPASENLSKQDTILWDIISSNQILLDIATKLDLNETHNGQEGSKIKESRKQKSKYYHG